MKKVPDNKPLAELSEGDWSTLRAWLEDELELREARSEAMQRIKSARAAQSKSGSEAES